MQNSYHIDYRSSIRLGLTIVLGSLIFLLVMYNRFIIEMNTSSLGIASLRIETEDIKRVFEGEVAEGMTVLEALQASALAGQISLDFETAEDGLRIVALDGYWPTKTSRQIVFYLNARKIELGDIQTTPIRPGDTVDIKVE